LYRYGAHRSSWVQREFSIVREVPKLEVSMKIVTGVSALLLGTSLLAGTAYAQNNNSSSPPPGWHVVGGSSHASAPPSSHGSPSPHFAGSHGAQNQARWNHVMTFHDHNVAHFDAQDRAMWSHGQWRHTKHNGRNGWWWYTNGAWFFYDEPTYPYPDTVSDDYSFDEDYTDAQPPGSDGGYVWYYCNNPPGYYPYIQSCRGPWQPVTPTAPPGYEQGPQQGGPYADQDDDRGPPSGPRDQYEDQQDGPPPGYNNGDDNDDDQGPPPSDYNNDQGPPPGYGQPPGYDDQPPPR
jgi:hypothetical protein